MARFRKRPIVVEAMRVPLTKDGSVAADVAGWSDLEAWLGAGGVWRPVLGGRVAIETLEGMMVALPGDWIIRGVRGEVYPIKEDIFRATYEEVE